MGAVAAVDYETLAALEDKALWDKHIKSLPDLIPTKNSPPEETEASV